MNIHYLDDMLKYLYDNRRYQYIDEIHKNFISLHDVPIIDVLVLLNKLVKDGYVTEEIIKITTTSASVLSGIKEKESTKSSYFISFEGVLFVEYEFVYSFLRNDRQLIKNTNSRQRI